MNFVRLLPVFMSFFLLGAHFSRAGDSIAALLCLAAPALLYFTTPVSARILQVLLILGAAEWFRTLMKLIALRQDYEMPFVRLTVILVCVTLFTAGSAMVFYIPGLKKKYFQQDE